MEEATEPPAVDEGTSTGPQLDPPGAMEKVRGQPGALGGDAKLLPQGLYYPGQSVPGNQESV